MTGVSRSPQPVMMILAIMNHQRIASPAFANGDAHDSRYERTLPLPAQEDTERSASPPCVQSLSRMQDLLVESPPTENAHPATCLVSRNFVGVLAKCSHCMLHILVAPVLVPRIVMLRKSIDDAPDHDDPAIEVFLRVAGALEPCSAELEHDYEDCSIADLHV